MTNIDLLFSALDITFLNGMIGNESEICDHIIKISEAINNEYEIFALLERYCKYSFYCTGYMFEKMQFWKLRNKLISEIDEFSPSVYMLNWLKKRNIRNVTINKLYYLFFSREFDYSVSNFIKENKVKSFNLSSGRLGHRFEMYDLNMLIDQIGYNEDITTFSFGDFETLDINKILLSFPNLTTLSLYSSMVSKDDKLIGYDFKQTPISEDKTFHNLTSLKLWNVCDGISNDEICDIVRRCPNLTNLGIRYGYNLEDSTLETLIAVAKNITVLKLPCCNKVSKKMLHKLVDTYPNLTELDLHWIKIIDDQFVIYIANKLRNLKLLDVSSFCGSSLLSDKTIACITKMYNIYPRASHIDEYIKKKLTTEDYVNFETIVTTVKSIE